jgi:hypothetical protein
MSKILRLALLVSVLGLIFTLLPSAPADAHFNSVYFTAPGLPTIRMDPNALDGVTFYVQTANGDARFMEIHPAGGHWEICTMTSMSTGSALELDSSGFPVVHQE